MSLRIAAVTQKPSSVAVAPCQRQLLSVAVQDCWRGGLVGCYGGGRVGRVGEEVVTFQFEILWELQLDLGLLDVARDGSDESFCMLAAEMKKEGPAKRQISEGQEQLQSVCVCACELHILPSESKLFSGRM